MTVKLEVEQLECTSCANNIENFLKKQKGINSWDISILERTVEVDYDPAVYSEADVAKLIKKSGFDAEIIED